MVVAIAALAKAVLSPAPWTALVAVVGLPVPFRSGLLSAAGTAIALATVTLLADPERGTALLVPATPCLTYNGFFLGHRQPLLQTKLRDEGNPLRQAGPIFAKDGNPFRAWPLS